MAKIDDLWDVFKAAKADAEAHFTKCKYFCNTLADIIKRDLGIPEYKHSVEINPRQKLAILTMTFPVPPGQAHTIEERFIVAKEDQEFHVTIEKTNEKFTFPEILDSTEQFGPVLDATFKYLRNVAISAAWQMP